MTNTWDAKDYDSAHSYVWRLGEGVVELLAPRAGERVLDVGCGTGHLTARIAESGAIVETLIERFGNGRLAPAPGTPDAVRYRYWLHFAEGSAMSPLLLKLVFDRIETTKMPFFAKPIAKAIASKTKSAFINPNIVSHLNFMETELGRSEWFAGDAFTGADIQMSFPVEAAQARGGLDAKRPKLMAYLERIHARPAYKRALERGGPYGLLS